MDIYDLTPTDLTLSDLATTPEPTPVDEGSRANIAAKTVYMGEEGGGMSSIMENFQTAYNFLSQDDNAFAMEMKKRGITQAMSRDQQLILPDLADPTISPITKESILQTVTDLNNSIYSPENLLSARIASRESPTANQEEEELRIETVYDMIGKVNDIERYAQAVVNRERSDLDMSVGATVGSLAEMIVPFTMSTNTGGLANTINQAFGVEGTSETETRASSWLLMGETKKEISEFLHKIPIDQRKEAIEQLATIIKGSPSIFIRDENNLEMLSNLSIGVTGDYTETQRFMDDAFSLLDLVGVGSAIRGITKIGSTAKATALAAKEAGTTEDVIKAAETIADIKMTKGGAQPSSLMDKAKDLNPEEARAIHAAISVTEDELVSKALTGTERVDAIGEKLLPSPKIAGNEHIVNEVHDIGKLQDVEEMAALSPMEYLNMDTKLFYTDEQIVAANAHVVKDFENPLGIRYNEAMSQIGYNEGTRQTEVRAIYQRASGAWTSAQRAVDQTFASLRNYAVERDQIKVGVLSGKTFIPVDEIEKAISEGVAISRTKPRYVTYVDYNHTFINKDMQFWDEPDVINNFFDRFKFMASPRMGSVVRHIADPASNFKKYIAGAAGLADDRSAYLVKLLADKGNDWSKGFGNLDKTRQSLVVNYIEEANRMSLPLSQTDLVARGFLPDEIATLKQWRSLQDEHFYLNNREYKARLADRGYGVYENPRTGDWLVAKPVDIDRVAATEMVIAHDGTIVSYGSIDKAMMKRDGWSISRLKDPVNNVEYAVSSNKPNQSLFRAFRPSDEALAYRDGYYQVSYKAPIYIETTFTRPDGTVYTRAVANAGTRQEAKELVDNVLPSQYPNKTFNTRFAKERNADRDDWADVLESYGQSSQKFRGQSLLAVTGQPVTLSGRHVLNPLESLSHSITSIARRVGMGDYLSATQERFMVNYKHLLKDKNTFPTSIDDIGKGMVGVSKPVADARTTFNYISFLQKGYYNHIDAVSQKAFETLFDMAGALKIGALEKGLHKASLAAPSVAVRKGTFMLTLASHPMRQWFVQASQGLNLAALDPLWVFSGKGLREGKALTLYPYIGGSKTGDKLLSKLMGVSVPEMKLAFKHLEESGLLANITRNNVTGGQLEDLARLNSSSLARRTLSKVVKAPYTFGFAVGESVNMASAFLAFRRIAMKTKPVLTTKDLQEITVLARNFTGNMNRAGDMAYNSNLLSMTFQFIQFPHKMFLNATTNRLLTPSQKVRVLAAQSLMWGLPFGAMVPTALAKFLPDDPVEREIIEDGLLSIILNKILSTFSGEETRVNFKASMQSMQLDFIMDIWKINLFDMSAHQQRAPASSIIKKIVEAGSFTMAHKYETMDDLLSVAGEFAKIASGVSAASKARYAWEVGQTINRYGDLTDDQVSKVEALALSLGFNTWDEAKHYAIVNRVNSQYSGTPKERSDVEEWYRTIKRVLLSEGVDHRDLNRNSMILSEFVKMFGRDPKAFDELASLMKKDLAKSDLTMFNYLAKASGWGNDAAVVEAIRENPRLSEAQKKALLDNIEILQKLEENKDGISWD